MGASFWDRFAGLYDLFERFNAKGYQNMVHAICALVPPGSDVLECAAGTGVISAALSPKARRILCTDYSLPMLDQAQKKARRLGLTNIDFAQRDIFSLEDRDDCYDAVIAANVLHLLETPRAAVKELWRVVRPGGVLILPTFLVGEAKWGTRQGLRLYRFLGFDPKSTYTQPSYQEMIDGCGLGKARYTLVHGRLPAGLAVLQKP